MGLKKKRNYLYTWSIRDEKFILKNVREEKIELCEIWFDNFAPKKWLARGGFRQKTSRKSKLGPNLINMNL